MAEIADDGGGGHGGKGKKRAKKNSTRVDMTPLVDLAFLLLTFFVLTSTFSDPKVMRLTYPAKQDETNDVKPPKVNHAITFLLSKDKIFYYKGEFKPETQLEETDFGPEGLRKLLTDENKSVIQGAIPFRNKVLEGKMTPEERDAEIIKLQKKPDALKVLIKTNERATCKNFIDLIDELKVASIGVIAPVDLTRSEEALINAKDKK